MRLFLTSSCISEELRKPFLKFLSKSPDKIKLYFIPTASDVEENKYYTCKSMDDFSVMGINPIWYALKFKTKAQISQGLSDADIIWIGGGNTFYLLDVMRKTGTLDIINDLVCNKNIAYGGTSAGTILATPSIEIAGWGQDADVNDVNINDLNSLNFVNFYTQVHYNPALDQNTINTKKGNYPIYAIPDGSAIQFIDNEITNFGSVEII